MRSLFGLSWKFLKKQWRRTLFTCVGIVMATALFTGVSLIAVSMQNMLVEDLIENEGAWEYGIGGISMEEAKALSAHIRVKDAQIIPHSKFYFTVEDEFSPEENHRVMLQDISFENEKDLVHHIDGFMNGRLPENENEILLNLGAYYIGLLGDDVWEMGSEITLQMKSLEDDAVSFEKTWTVVGTTFSWGENLSGTMFAYTVVPKEEQGGVSVFLNMKGMNGTVDGFLKAAKDAVSDLPYETEEDFNARMATDNSYFSEDPTVFMHKRLLLAKGVSWNSDINAGIFTIVGILGIIIFLAVIVVIRNSLYMSVNERVSEFGLLRVVGGSPSQMRGLVLSDALQMACIGIPLGVLAGVGAMQIVIQVVKDVELGFLQHLHLIVSPLPIIVAAGLSFFSVFLSALGPMLRAGRLSAMEAIRKSDAYHVSVKKEKNLKRKGKLFRIFFGISGSLSVKNIRRDRRRFRTTAISVMVSAFLFVVVASFASLLDSTINRYSGEGTDFLIETYMEERSGTFSTNKETMLEVFEYFSSHPSIEKIEYHRMISSVLLLLESSDYDKDFSLKYFGEIFEEVPALLSSYSFVGIDKERLSSLGVENEEEIWEKMENGEALLYQMQSLRGTTGNSIFVRAPLTNYRTGDDFPLNETSYEKYFEFDEGVVVESVEPEISLRDLGFSDSVRIAGEVYEEPWFLPIYDGSAAFIFSDTYLETLFSETNAMVYEKYFPYYAIRIDAKEGQENDLERDIRAFFGILGEDTFSYTDGEHNGVSFRLANYYQSLQEERDLVFVAKVFLYGFVTVIMLISITNILNIIHTNILLRRREFGMLQAIGMSRAQTYRMLFLECILYGLSGAFWGVILGSIVHVLLMIEIDSFSSGMVLTYIPLDIIFFTLAGVVLISVIAGIFPIRKVMKNRVMEMIRSQE